MKNAGTAEKKRHPRPGSRMDKKRRAALIASAALTAAIAAVMNLALIPTIEAAAGGLRCFDMRFGYAYPDALSFLSALSAEGKRLYLTRQLPLDFLYPLAYGAFFAAAFAALTGKKTPLAALPVLLAAADYTENACILLMLRADPPARSLVALGSAATIVKTVLMYLCFLTLAALLFRAVIRKKNFGLS